MAEKFEVLQCQTKSCIQAADVFCSVCSKLFCEQHIQVHNTLFDDHKLLDTGSYQEQQNILKVQNCTVHDVQLTHCCEQCYTIMCDICMNQQNSSACSVAKGAHILRTISHVSDLIRLRLQDSLSEVTVREFQISDDLKLYVNQYEGTQNRHRDLLDEIQMKTEHMITEASNSLKADVLGHMSLLKVKVGETEQAVDNHKEKFERVRTDTHRLISELQPINIIKESRRMIAEITKLKTFTMMKPDLKQLKLHETGEKVALPFSLDETEITPQLDFQRLIAAVGESLQSDCAIWSCIQVSTGEMICATDRGLLGAKLGLKLDVGKIVAMYELTMNLYILQEVDDRENQADILLLHVMDLQTLGKSSHVLRSVKYISPKNHIVKTHIAVSNNHVAVSHYSEAQPTGVEIYSLKGYKFKRLLKHTNMSSFISGIQFTRGQTLIVADKVEGRITNFISISKANPKIKWEVQIDNPEGMTMNDDRTVLLIISDERLHILSYKGEQLRTVFTDCGHMRNLSMSCLNGQKYLFGCDGGKEVTSYKLIYKIKDTTSEMDHVALRKMLRNKNSVLPSQYSKESESTKPGKENDNRKQEIPPLASSRVI